MFVSVILCISRYSIQISKDTILNVMLVSKDVVTLSCMTQNDRNLFFCSSGVARFKINIKKLKSESWLDHNSRLSVFSRSALVCDNILGFKAITLHLYVCPSSHELCVSMCAHMCVCESACGNVSVPVGVCNAGSLPSS